MHSAAALTMMVVLMFWGIRPGVSSAMSDEAGFDVASIRASNSVVSRGSFKRMDVGVLVISGMTVRELIETAYSLKSYQVVGAPAWGGSRRYDVSAKDTTLAPVDSRRLSGAAWSTALDENDRKLRLLLQERFGLVVHREQRSMPIFDLEVNTKNRLRSVPCGASYFLSPGLARGAMKLSWLAALLSRELGRPVRDVTGLAGCYDLTMTWTEDPGNDQGDSVGSVLKDAGLRLHSRRGFGDVLMIDKVKEPVLD